MRPNYSIAIDGPSGAGKSSVARLLAQRLDFIYVDTGAIYRTVGLYAYRNGVDSKDEAGVTALLPAINITFSCSAGLQRMSLNGEDVTDAIREHVISGYASDVSAMPAVREFLLQMQRDAAASHDVIMDGRDIGTVVLPDASLKIFLTASAEERARRRWLELQAKGDTTPLEQVLEDINTRDYNDTHRAIAPLRQAEDARLFDTSTLTLDQVVDALEAWIRESLSL